MKNGVDVFARSDLRGWRLEQPALIGDLVLVLKDFRLLENWNFWFLLSGFRFIGRCRCRSWFVYFLRLFSRDLAWVEQSDGVAVSWYSTGRNDSLVTVETALVLVDGLHVVMVVIEVCRVANVEGRAAGGANARLGAALTRVQSGGNRPNARLPSGSTARAGFEFFGYGSITHTNFIRSKLLKIVLQFFHLTNCPE